MVAYTEFRLVEETYFSVNVTTCTNTLLSILNGCPPFSALQGTPLLKYGGRYTVLDSLEDIVNCYITMSVGDPEVN